MAHVGKLPVVHRYITTHDAGGKSVFSSQFEDEARIQPLPDNIGFSLPYATEGFPVDMSDEQDIKIYQKHLSSPPGLIISTGTVLRHVDFPPNNPQVMHRTVSLDYGVVLEGEIICELNSGQARHMRRGDVCIQRGTMHAWRNPSSTEWTRMLFILQASQPLIVNGQELGEDITQATGVPDSS